MKTFPWLIAGVGVGLAAYFVLNQPSPRYATGNDEVENAADKTSLWGSKQRVYGKGGRVVGKLKEGIGRAIGDDQLAGQGIGDQVVGAVKDSVGEVGRAIGETIHDLNR